MDEEKLPDKSDIDTGGGNYNKQIKGNYVQGNYYEVVNNYQSKDSSEQKGSSTNLFKNSPGVFQSLVNLKTLLNLIKTSAPIATGVISFVILVLSIPLIVKNITSDRLEAQSKLENQQTAIRSLVASSIANPQHLQAA